MLSLQLKSGDYLTIGKDVVVQVFKGSGQEFRVSIKAPREVPIVRGEVLERDGKSRPEGLHDRPPKKSPSDYNHSARWERRQQGLETRSDAVRQMRAILDRLASQPALNSEVQALRTQLERMEQPNGAETVALPEKLEDHSGQRNDKPRQ